MKIGASFDPQYAISLGLDIKDSLKRIFDLNISPIRVSIKWNRVEEKQGHFSWKDYEDIFEILQDNQVPIILVIGMKSARWPEYYIPDWLKFNPKRGTTISIKDQYLKERLFNFISETMQKFNNVEIIKYLQIENEPLFKFGPHNWSISAQFLRKEIEYIKTLTKLPIVLTSPGLPTTGLTAEYLSGRKKQKDQLLEQLSNIIGLNVFPKIEGTFLNIFNKTYTASNHAWKYLKQWVRKIENSQKDCWITELQAEPWEGGKINFKDAYANKTCDPGMGKEYLKQLEEIGINTVLIWGTEFHLACEKQGNKEWVDRIYNNQ